MRPIIFRQSARKEFNQAADWYEREQVGLGNKFLAEVELLLQCISIHAEQFPILHRDARKAVVQKFPYCTVFTFASGMKRLSCLPFFIVPATR